MDKFEQLCAALAAFGDEHWRIFLKCLHYQGVNYPEGVRELAKLSEKALDSSREYVGVRVVAALGTLSNKEKALENALAVIKTTQANITTDCEGMLRTFEILEQSRKNFPALHKVAQKAAPAPQAAEPDYW